MKDLEQRATTLPLAKIQTLYDDDYYQHDCDGHREYARTGGRKLPKRLAKLARLAKIEAQDTILDLGCGRGELSLYGANRGATVFALDPATSAVRMTHAAAQLRVPTEGSIHVVQARGEQLPFPSNSASLILASDVVEHLPPEDLAQTLDECSRVLAPGGRLCVHTQPNRILVDWTVPVLSRVSRLWGVRLPRDLRSEMTTGAGPEYHVNEQSLRSLGRAIKQCGLQIEELWLEGSYPLHRIFGEQRPKRWLLSWFRRSSWMKNLFASQLFAVARKK